MNLHQLLGQLDAAIRVGLIGAGKFGTMFLAQARHITGLHVAGVADLNVDHAEQSLRRVGWQENEITLARTAGEINDVASRQEVAVVDSADTLIAADLDVVVECTGDPHAGARHALSSFAAGHHVVMVTVEADAVVGPILRQRADRAGVVYSMAYGDQPALVCELVDWARTCGFAVVAAGKGTKHLPAYHYSTPDTVVEHYGFSDQQLRDGDFNAKMFNSFLDGTKSAIEMAAIANATGLKPQPDGLQFRPVSCDQLAEVLKPQSAGGTLSHSGTVEVVSCLHEDGREVTNHLRWGVYVTFAASSDYTRDCFQQYGIVTDDSGRYGALYRPSHLIGLELPVSVASVALRQVPTGSPHEFVGDVVACAKRDLQIGETLDGEGGYCVYGKLLPAQTSVAGRGLPIGLAAQVPLKRSVAQDTLLTYDDVELPDSQLLQLRRELETGTRFGDTGAWPLPR